MLSRAPPCRGAGADRVLLGSDYPFPLGEQRIGSLVRGSSSLTAAERAADLLVRGPLKKEFWVGSILLGCVAPLTLITLYGVGGWSTFLAGILAVAGSYWWDRVWVKAGQAIPLS